MHTNAPEFWSMPHFGMNFFRCQDSKFTLIVTYVHPIKQSHNQVTNSDTCGVFNKVLIDVCPSITFSNNKNTTKL